MQIDFDYNIKKIIPCLDTKNGKLVKGVEFENVKEIGNPVELAKQYSDAGADELVLYDISASMEGRTIFTSLVKDVLSVINLPLVVGGGISTLEDFETAFKNGVSKVSINSGAIKNPAILEKAVKEFGSEKVVLSADINKVGDDYFVFSNGGRKNTGLNALEWLKTGESAGVGEMVINSIKEDGVKKGFDISLLNAISQTIKTPLIASGGAGSMDDFLEVFEKIPTVTGGLGASVFHFGEIEIPKLRSFLKNNGIKF